MLIVVSADSKYNYRQIYILLDLFGLAFETKGWKGYALRVEIYRLLESVYLSSLLVNEASILLPSTKGLTA